MKTGEMYLMYDLPIASWPAGGAPRIVYECPACRGRFPPDDWKSGCPGCAKKAKEDKEKAEKKAKHRRSWTLTQD
jgi:hypothetical protein